MSSKANTKNRQLSYARTLAPTQTNPNQGTQAGTEVLDEDTAGLWMAGKEFRRDQAVGDRVGKNEKTRVMCKLQNPGSGPPGREPGVSEAERKAMMAFYFKRQEELKRLAEVRDDVIIIHGRGGFISTPFVLFCFVLSSVCFRFVSFIPLYVHGRPGGLVIPLLSY